MSRLHTHRLTLRPPADTDADRFVRLLGNLEVSRMLERVPHPYAHGDARSFIDRMAAEHAAGTDHAFTVLLGEQPIGCVGLHRRERGDRELGYWLGAPYWGRGYMTEAAGAVCRFGFESLGLARIVAGCFADNPASCRVLEKLGFRYSGVARHYSRARAEMVDLHEMSLDAAAFRTVSDRRRAS